MKLLHNILLRDYTTWRTGGAAKRVFKPNSLSELQSFLTDLPEDEKLFFLGLGSNTLIRDAGFDGTVILLQGGLQQLEEKEPGLIRVEAGLSCAALSRKTARLNLSGLEFMAGIPGTVGGALRMNAGCHGGETWNHVTQVETIDYKGNIQLRTADDFNIAYRTMKGLAEREWFVAAWFQLKPGDKKTSLDKIKQLLAARAKTQPTNEYTCGSVFRNPPGDHAARLIESCGLKGYTLENAQVSSKHANFIRNCGQASSKNIEDLIKIVSEKVLQETGIQLKREVRIIGETENE